MTGTGYTMAHRMSATLPCDKRGVAAVSNALPHELKMSRQRGVAANAPPAHSRNSMLSACFVDGEPMATRQPGRGRAAGTLFLICTVAPATTTHSVGRELGRRLVRPAEDEWPSRTPRRGVQPGARGGRLRHGIRDRAAAFGWTLPARRPPDPPRKDFARQPGRGALASPGSRPFHQSPSMPQSPVPVLPPLRPLRRPCPLPLSRLLAL